MLNPISIPWMSRRRCLRACAALPLALAVPAHAGRALVALAGATLYATPTDPPLRDAVVLVRDNLVWRTGTREQVRIPPGARVIDCRGMTLVAGFWNSHVHLMEPHWLRADTLPAAELTGHCQRMLTGHGFTSVFDLATLDIGPLLRLRARIARGDVAGPAIYLAGTPMTPASPFYIEPLRLPVVQTPEGAARHVTRQAAAGADGIKLWSASPTGKAVVTMEPAVLAAAVAAAHARGLPVFAHPTDLGGAEAAVAAGVDVLVHVAPEDGRDWPPALLQAMLARRVALIPTLKLYQWELARSGHRSHDHPLLRTAIAQLTSYAAAGGSILFGTDVGYVKDYSPAAEYALMRRAGLSFPRILAALTTAPAQRFQPGRRIGKVLPGYQADLVVLRGDPARDITQLARVAHTMRAGRLVYSSGAR